MAAFFLYLMAALYFAAGINHFWHPKVYLRIIPAYIPFHELMVALSGACEMLFALLLLFPATRVWGAWLIIALLVAVFPANVQMALDWHRKGSSLLWLALLRLPLQVALIWWAWRYTKPML